MAAFDSSDDDGEPVEPDKAEVEIDFLSFEDVCEIHDKALAEFGHGLPGFLDEHAVRSAIGQPEAGMSHAYFHAFPAGMAAAYLYYIANQQGFLNANKRAAVGAALEFLARNGYRLTASNYEVYEITVSLAGENVKGDRKEILATLSKWIEKHLAPME
jgi:death-on-curing protein